MERICDPYMPRSNVKKAFISALLPDEIVQELQDMGIKTYKLGRTPNILSELSYHPDILLNNFRKGQWMCENDPKYLPKDLPRSLFVESEAELGDLYPYDCLFNNFRLGKALICGMGTDYLIRAYADYDEYRIIYVEQNYVKCCCIPVTDNAVITCDYYIGRALRKNGYDVLTVKDCDRIGLKGYSHGLIGGCAAKLSDKLIGFTGDLNQYTYGDDIRDFCANYNIDAFSLSSKPMYDYGGILPITENIPKADVGISTPCDF